MLSITVTECHCSPTLKKKKNKGVWWKVGNVLPYQRRGLHSHGDHTTGSVVVLALPLASPLNSLNKICAFSVRERMKKLRNFKEAIGRRTSEVSGNHKKCWKRLMTRAGIFSVADCCLGEVGAGSCKHWTERIRPSLFAF